MGKWQSSNYASYFDFRVERWICHYQVGPLHFSYRSNTWEGVSCVIRIFTVYDSKLPWRECARKSSRVIKPYQCGFGVRRFRGVDVAHAVFIHRTVVGRVEKEKYENTVDERVKGEVMD